MEEAGPGIHRVVTNPDSRTKGSHFALSTSTQAVCTPSKARSVPARATPFPGHREESVSRHRPGGAGGRQGALAPASSWSLGATPTALLLGSPICSECTSSGREGAGPRAFLPLSASPKPPPAGGLLRGSLSGGRRCGASLRSPGARCALPPPPPPPWRRRVPPPSSLGGWEAAAAACCASAREGGGREEAPGATAAAEPHGQRARRGRIYQRCGAANKGEQRRREVGCAASRRGRARGGGRWSPASQWCARVGPRASPLGLRDLPGTSPAASLVSSEASAGPWGRSLPGHSRVPSASGVAVSGDCR